MKIYENNWESMEIIRKSMKLIEYQWKSMEIIENPWESIKHLFNINENQ